MVAGLAFLSKKSFNPKNLSNQKTVWEKQQAKRFDERAQLERSQQLQREQEEEELARVRHGAAAGEKTQLKFMYSSPPGMILSDGNGNVGNIQNEKQNERHNPKREIASVCNKNKLTTIRQPGDDDAAAAFRAMLAMHNNENPEQQEMHQESKETYSFSNSSGAALQGSTVEREFDADNDCRSALEKAVGRRDGGGALTLKEQVARFPQLKNAPVAKGMSATDVQVNFKPLGTQLRNVRCLACGIWGHSRGDRECTKSGWDPFNIKSGKEFVQIPVNNTTNSKDERIYPQSLRSQRGSLRKSEEKMLKRRHDSGQKYSYNSEDCENSSDSLSSYERRKRRRRKKEKEKKRRKKRRRLAHGNDSAQNLNRRHYKNEDEGRRSRR